MVLWGHRRWRSRAVPVAIVYLVFLGTITLEHDDLAPHLKDPTHCTACMSSPIGSFPQTPAAFGAGTLNDAGRVLTMDVVHITVLLPTHSTGRSPPSSI
jgi:hypothetical protein